MSARSLFQIIALLAAGRAALAVEAISYPEFRSAVEARDPELRAQAAEARAGEAAHLQARGALLPSVGFQAQYARVSDVGGGEVTLPLPARPVTVDLSPYIPDQWGVSARIEQTLWDGRAYSQWKASGHEWESAKAALSRSRRDLRFRSLQAWCELWSALREADAADSARAAISEQRRILSLMVAEGSAIANDSLRAVLLQRQSELAVLAAGNRVENARARVASLLGRSLDVDLLVADSVPSLEIPSRGGDAPEIVQARERAEAASWNKRAQESAFLPVVSSGLLLQDLRPNPRVVPAADKWQEDWRVWVALQWNLFRGGMDRYGTLRAGSLEDAARCRAQVVEEGRRLDATTARRGLDLARERLSTAREVLRLAREDRDLFEKRAAAGTALRADLLDRIAQVWRAQAECAQALAGETLARASLRVAMGLDLP